jgi:hypothetical protein
MWETAATRATDYFPEEQANIYRQRAAECEALAERSRGMKVEELAAKQDQMSQNIVTLQAVEQDIIQERSSPPLSGPVSPPPRKKARRVAPRKLVEQSSSVPPPPAFRPQ